MSIEIPTRTIFQHFENVKAQSYLSEECYLVIIFHFVTQRTNNNVYNNIFELNIERAKINTDFFFLISSFKNPHVRYCYRKKVRK